MIRRAAPFCFVILWSTGWIVARYVADFADPLAFLIVRFAFAAAILAPIAVFSGAKWPAGRADWFHAGMSGALLHTGYLGCVWWAVQHGLSASVSALIAALQPILTAIFAPLLLAERMSRERVAGVALGFTGLVMVLAPRVSAVSAPGATAAGVLIAVNCVAMVSATAGTFYQKRFIRDGDLRTVALVQYGGAIATMIPAALIFGDLHFHWSWFAFGVLTWSVLGISIGAIALLLVLIRQGEVTRAAQLIFLVPPVAALQGMLLFHDSLTPLQWLGMAVSAVGVALASRIKPA